MNNKVFWYFKRLPLRYKIILSFVCMGALTFVLIFFVYQFKKTINDSNRVLSVFYYPFQQKLNQQYVVSVKSSQLLYQYLESGKKEIKDEWQIVWSKSLKEAFDYQIDDSIVSNLAENYFKVQDSMSLLHQIQLNLMAQIDQELVDKAYYDTNESDMSAVEGDPLAFFEASHSTALGDTKDKIYQAIRTKNDLYNNRMHMVCVSTMDSIENQIARYSEQINASFDNLWFTCAIVAILTIFLGIFLTFALFRDIVKQILGIKHSLKFINQGKLPEVQKESKSEMNFISRELNKLIVSLASLEKLAYQVGEGNFNSNVNVFEGKGQLGESIFKMQESLQRVADENWQRDWQNEGLSQIAQIIRANKDLQVLYDALVLKLVNYVGAVQGALFICERQGKQDVLKLKACYAFDRKKYLDKAICKGEGLIGQVWQEGEAILLTEIPTDHLEIKSGLGDAPPRCLTIVPMIFNEVLVGIMEFAYFEKIDEYKFNFLQQANQEIASAILSAISNNKAIDSAEESQKQMEEMRHQEAQLLQNIEQLQGTQEEMYRIQLDMNQQIHEFKNLLNSSTDNIIALNKDYHVLIINSELINRYKKRNIPIKEGDNILEILPPALIEKWKPRYDRALAGETFQIIEQSVSSSTKQIFETHHNPIFNEQGTIIGVSVISRDVTHIVESTNS